MARAVVVVAGMDIPENEQALVLAAVTAKIVGGAEARPATWG